MKASCLSGEKDSFKSLCLGNDRRMHQADFTLERRELPERRCTNLPQTNEMTVFLQSTLVFCIFTHYNCCRALIVHTRQLRPCPQVSSYRGGSGNGLFLLLVVGVTGILALAFAFVSYRRITRFTVENERVAELSEIIHRGAMAFLTGSINGFFRF